MADVDFHIIEPADLWTSRISPAWGALVPHVRFHERRQEDVWYIGDRKLYGAGAFAQAGWPEFPPSHPKTLSVVLSGVCHRYPELKFVSVGNGAGWLPFLGEAMDWQWLNVGAHKEYPERLLPSEYLRRQIFGMYWFEKESLRSVIDRLAGNLMFETDFPHATSLSPGPASESRARARSWRPRSRACPRRPPARSSSTPRPGSTTWNRPE